MRFVLFDSKTLEIKGKASSDRSLIGSLVPGLQIGVVEDHRIRGDRKNYIFVQGKETYLDGKYPKGFIERKPEEECDLEADEKVFKEAEITRRFHKLDITELTCVEVYLMLTSEFRKFGQDINTYKCTIEAVPLKVTLSRKPPIPIEAYFEFGGYSISFRQTELKFELTGQEVFIREAINTKLGSFKPHVSISHIIKNESLKFALKVANHIIECYRIAYNDPEEKPVGITDILSSATIFTLYDGHKCPSLSSPQLGKLTSAPLNGDEESIMQSLIEKGKAPFMDIAIAELKKAHFYGQHKECLVWAGVIISNIIEQILLENLPNDSQEYKRVKNNSADVRGKTKRNSYFKKAIGYTLAELLTQITTKLPYRKEYETWRNLAKYVEIVLNDRNLLLHRRKAVGMSEGDMAYETCMNFIYALRYGVPYLDNTYTLL